MNCSDAKDIFAHDLLHDELLARLKGVTWCGKCEQCLYGFMMAATVLPMEELLDVFGVFRLTFRIVRGKVSRIHG